jgi:hypothetical protein
MEATGVVDGLEVIVGGLSRAELASQLSSSGVLLNSHAETLLSTIVFDRRPSHLIALVERSVAQLGFAEGTTLPTIFRAALQQGLALCPAYAGPYLRLALDDQIDAPDTVMTSGRAPTGSLTVASAPLKEDYEYPKGFYLRVIAGQKWLRGYRCDDEHVWSGEDRFVFRLPLSEMRVTEGKDRSEHDRR